MPDSTRTFLAVPVPGSLTANLERLQRLLGPVAPEVRWTVSLPFHITLAFLGDVPHTDLNAVCLAAEDATARHAPFSLRLETLGAFPDPSRPRVVWVGVAGAGLDALHALQGGLAATLAATGYPDDPHPFRPHVTLGRLKPRRGSATDLTAPLLRYKGWNTQEFRVETVVAYGSSPSPDGPVYTPLHRARLGRRKPARGA